MREFIVLLALVIVALIGLFWKQQCKPGTVEPPEWSKNPRNKHDAA